jgi:subtilisin family serine protease
MKLLIIASLLAQLGLSATVPTSGSRKTYIATLPKGADMTAEVDAARDFGAMEAVPFDINGFRGFIFKGDDRLAEQLKSSRTGVKVYEDGEASGQEESVWGLDRINQRDLPLDNNIDVSATGQGVTVYVVDSGIFVNHNDFEGRATWGANFVDGELDVDCNGHGTHVAGTIMSKTYGVAKQAEAIAVKVLNCNNKGSWSGIIKGIEWAVNDAESKGLSKVVMNLSLGGGNFDPIDQAVNAVVDAGIHVAVAAGNDALDACLHSPASALKSFTIGATDAQDQFADFSNFGTCVHLNAPGVDITSTSNTGETAMMSGTSMATPHVAGVLALHLETENYTPADLKAKLIELSSQDKITLIPDSPPTPNLLLFFS